MEDLLNRMSEADAIACLTSTYGRGRDTPDEDGLFEGTTAILHAARSGKQDMFSSVLRMIRMKLTLQQVNRAIDHHTKREVDFTASQ